MSTSSTSASTTVPKPRSGLAGGWDKFIGPGATWAENILMLGTAVVALVAAVLYQRALNQTTAQVVVGALLAFDVIGGAVANATLATKRWYHSHGPLSQFLFILPHLLHLAVAGWMFTDRPGPCFAVYASLLLASTVAIVLTPRYLKSPVATTCLLMVLTVWIYAEKNDLLPTIVGMEWLIPMLYIKLLTGHLVPETPYDQQGGNGAKKQQ